MPSVLIDFDGVIAIGGAFPKFGAPMPGARTALQMLQQRGYGVRIWSSRMYFGNGELAQSERQHEQLAEWLAVNRIPFHEIERGTCGKPPADYYIDDKAIRHDGKPDTWRLIVDRILKTGCNGGI